MPKILADWDFKQHMSTSGPETSIENFQRINPENLKHHKPESKDLYSTSPCHPTQRALYNGTAVGFFLQKCTKATQQGEDVRCARAPPPRLSEVFALKPPDNERIHKTITSHQQTKTIPSKVSHSEHEHLRNSSIHRFPQIIDHPNMCLALF